MSQSLDDLASLLTPLERGESLPARWYTDPAITEREIHQIFRKTWSYVSPANELTNLGDYITGFADNDGVTNQDTFADNFLLIVQGRLGNC